MEIAKVATAAPTTDPSKHGSGPGLSAWSSPQESWQKHARVRASGERAASDDGGAAATAALTC